MTSIDRARLRAALDAERRRFVADHPRSAALFERAKASLFEGVPMNWMVRWAGDFPVFVETASGARFTDVDGRDYLDLCLGDTGAMTGHSPTATDANRFAIRLARQITGRRLILVYNGCYHGTVDETLVTLTGGKTVARRGNVGPAVDPALTTRVVELHELPAPGA